MESGLRGQAEAHGVLEIHTGHCGLRELNSPHSSSLQLYRADIGGLLNKIAVLLAVE